MRYGIIKNDFVVIKGSCPGVRKRVVTLRKSLINHTSRAALEKINLKVSHSVVGPSVPSLTPPPSPVHRYLEQVRSRSFPDRYREVCVRGTEEGQGCLSLLQWFLFVQRREREARWYVGRNSSRVRRTGYEPLLG